MGVAGLQQLLCFDFYPGPIRRLCQRNSDQVRELRVAVFSKAHMMRGDESCAPNKDWNSLRPIAGRWQ